MLSMDTPTRWAWTANGQDEKIDVRKSELISVLPDTLMFQINRLIFQNGKPFKMNDPFEFPLELRMSEFMDLSRNPNNYDDIDSTHRKTPEEMVEDIKKHIGNQMRENNIQKT